MKNYYDTLGVSETASDKEIKSAFRKLAGNIIPTKVAQKPNSKRSTRPTTP